MATHTLTRTFAWTDSRLGWRAEALALALIALVVGSLAADRVLTAATTPAAYAERYVSARAAGDVSGTWASIQVEPAQADVSLVTQQGLAAMLRLPDNRSAAHSISAQTVSQSSRSATVDITYSDGHGLQKQVLQLVRIPVEKAWLTYPRWRVTAPAAVIQLPATVAGASVTLDGLEIPSSARTVAVFSGNHQLAVGPTAMFQAETETVVATSGIVSAGLRPTLSPQVVDQAKSAVAAGMAACAKATSLAPANCPQSVTDDINGGATWQLFGDPTANAVFTVNDPTTVAADGRYQMAVSYQGLHPDVPRHRAAPGTYQALLTWNGTAFTVKSIGQPSTAVPDIARPAADDAAVLAAVKGAFDRCAAATVIGPALCPQSVGPIGTVSNLSWRLDRDPVAGASVTYSGSEAMFRVSGTYAMTATYDETNPYEPTFHRNTQDTGRYAADLFWDGQKVVFIAFE